MACAALNPHCGHTNALDRLAELFFLIAFFAAAIGRQDTALTTQLVRPDRLSCRSQIAPHTLSAMETSELGELPDPDGEELRNLVPRTSARVIYGILYRHRTEGITMQEVRRIAAPILAELGVAGEQEQLDRRKRDL